MNDRLSLNEYKVLELLYSNSYTSLVDSLPTSEIAKKLGYSYFTIRNLLKSLFLAGMVLKGFKAKNSETFYLSQYGKEVLEFARNSGY